MSRGIESPGRGLEALLCADSLVIVGASADFSRLGGMPVRSLLDGGFPPERLLLVNPKYREIAGLPCHASLRELPWTPALAVLAVSRDATLAALADCHAAGIRAAVLFASGFAEEHTREGEQARQRLVDLARDTGMLISGPNCLGFANFHDRLFATFMKNMTLRSEPGSVAVVAQSGNMAGLLRSLGLDAGLRFSFVISTGNEDCLDFTDYLAFLAEDPRVQQVLGYVEQIRDGVRFLRVAQRMRQLGKPLFLLKAGSSRKGAEAAASHTAAMAGDAQAYATAFRQLGICEATDPIRLVDLARLSRQRARTQGVRVCIVSVSGAGGALVADHLSRCGLEVPTLCEATQARLRAVVPSYGMVTNPVDLTGQVTNDRASVTAVVDAIADDPDIDAVVYYLVGPALGAAAGQIALSAAAGRQLALMIDTAPSPSHAALEAAGVPVFIDLNRAAAALAGRLRAQSASASHWQPVGREPAIPGHGAITVSPADALLTEVEVKALLRAAGLPMVSEHLACSAEEAGRCAESAAEEVGWPVVMKVVSRDVPHKTEAGGVRLDVGSTEAARRAYAEIVLAVRRAHPGARIDGVVVQPLIEAGQSVLVGLVRDPVFGWMMTVGLGGVLTELYADLAHRLLPVDSCMAHEMLRELRSFPLLAGYRGSAPCDVEALAGFIEALSRFVLEHGERWAELEINPVIALPVGRGVVAVDALARHRA